MRTTDPGKLPPQAAEIEEAVLGTMLSHPKSIIDGVELLNAKSFYKPSNEKIFKAIQELNSKNRDIDILTIVEQLRKDGNLQIAGGIGYISQLINRIGSSGHFEGHCLILREKQISRNQIRFASELIERAYDEEKADPIGLNTWAADQVFEISNISNLRSEVSFEELSQEIIKDAETASQNNGVVGLRTGFKEQDITLKGLKGGQSRILAARPGMGKTAFILTEAYNIGVVQEKKVIVFSLEMTRKELLKRLLSIHSEVGVRLYEGKLTNQTWQQLHQSLDALCESNIILVDNCRTMQQVRNRCKKEASKEEISKVYIDYLQLMEGEGFNRENVISSISRSIKKTAIEMNIPFTTLSQLSRSVEKRGGDRRPVLSDLRESGAIEQDADIVQFLYRPQYYSINEDQFGSTTGVAYLLIAKHRGGALRDLRLQYVHNRTLFRDFDEVSEEKEIDDLFNY